MPQNNRYRPWKHTIFMMSLVRCLISFSYLWLMIHCAALQTVLIDTSTSFLWRKTLQYSISYGMLLDRDGRTQGLIIFGVLMALYRLYQCCRCNFSQNKNENHYRSGDKIEWTSHMYFYFGPYMGMFVGCWLISVSLAIKQVSRISKDQPTNSKEALYAKLAIFLLFKLIILLNAIVRIIRIAVIQKIFEDEPEEELRNIHNFGEHLNLFFQT